MLCRASLRCLRYGFNLFGFLVFLYKVRRSYQQYCSRVLIYGFQVIFINLTRMDFSLIERNNDRNNTNSRPQIQFVCEIVTKETSYLDIEGYIKMCLTHRCGSNKATTIDKFSCNSQKSVLNTSILCQFNVCIKQQ